MESIRVHDEIIVPMEIETMNEEKKTTTRRLERNVEEPVETEKKKDMKNFSRVTCQVAQVLLRFLAALCMLGAIIMMLFFTEETATILGFTITASYRSSPASVFYVIGSTIAGLYSILSISCVYCCPRSRYLHVLDMLVMALAVAAFSAATAVGYIGLFGNDETGWSKVCSYVQRFCFRGAVSLGLSFVGVVVLFFVATLSAA